MPPTHDTTRTARPRPATTNGPQTCPPPLERTLDRLAQDIGTVKVWKRGRA